MRLRDGDVAAVLILCVLGGVALAGYASGRPVQKRGIPAPVPDRVDSLARTVDPNTASVASLRRLPGLGPAKARAIVSYRAAHGPAAFGTPEDLKKVHGIGPGLLQRMQPFVRISNDSSTTSVSPR